MSSKTLSTGNTKMLSTLTVSHFVDKIQRLIKYLEKPSFRGSLFISIKQMKYASARHYRIADRDNHRMAKLNQLDSEFLIPYITILNYFKYTGINIFDLDIFFIYRLKKSMHIMFFLFLCSTVSHWQYVVQKIVTTGDLLELAVDLSYCLNCIEGKLIYINNKLFVEHQYWS